MATSILEARCGHTITAPTPERTYALDELKRAAKETRCPTCQLRERDAARAEYVAARRAEGACEAEARADAENWLVRHGYYRFIPGAK